MIPTFSPFGCPGDFFNCDTEKKIKLIIDPFPHYFSHQIRYDRENNDILVLIQGMEPKELNNISKEVISNKTFFLSLLTLSGNIFIIF